MLSIVHAIHSDERCSMVLVASQLW